MINVTVLASKAAFLLQSSFSVSGVGDFPAHTTVLPVEPGESGVTGTGWCGLPGVYLFRCHNSNG